jgi:hypothetical protein
MGQSWNNKKEEDVSTSTTVAQGHEETRKKSPTEMSVKLSKTDDDTNDGMQEIIEPHLPGEDLTTVSGVVDEISEKKPKPSELEEGECTCCPCCWPVSCPACPCCSCQIPGIPCTGCGCPCLGGTSGGPGCGGSCPCFAYLPWPCGGHGCCAR